MNKKYYQNYDYDFTNPFGKAKPRSPGVSHVSSYNYGTNPYNTNIRIKYYGDYTSSRYEMNYQPYSTTHYSRNQSKDESTYNNNPIKVLDSKYIFSTKKDSAAQQDTKRTSYNNRGINEFQSASNNNNPIQILDPKYDFLSTKKDSTTQNDTKRVPYNNVSISKIKSTSNINNDNNGPIQFLDPKYDFLSTKKDSTTQNDTKRAPNNNININKFKSTSNLDNNPIIVLDHDISNKILNTDDTDSDSENDFSYFTDSQNSKSDSSKKSKYKVGDLIFVGSGKKTFHYIGRSGEFILAIDSKGIIHKIPDDVKIQ